MTEECVHKGKWQIMGYLRQMRKNGDGIEHDYDVLLEQCKQCKTVRIT